MPRYIDGDKLCEYYQERHKNLCLKNGETDAYCQGYEDAMYVAEHHDFTANVVPKSEVDKLEYTLLGVMHSVDKWLEGDELKQDEVNRAITMREKTLRIIENAKTEVAREIFDEILRTIFSKIPNKIMLINQERGFSDGVIFGKREAFFDMVNNLAELKKKYEVQNDG